MQVTILSGQQTAIDVQGRTYPVHGVELIRQSSKAKIFYPKEDIFYQVACPENTVHNAYLMSNGNIMIL